MDVTRQYKDGRMDILTVGQRRFEILLTNTERPYLRGAVDYFDDKGPDAPSEERAERVIKIFRDAMRRLRHAADMPDHLALPYRRLSFRLAAALPVDLEFKQQLLALRNETERLASLQRALEVFLKQLERVQESQRKVGGNGHARR
jgi:Lon protease-like protein